jgi:hypothetical protein
LAINIHFIALIVFVFFANLFAQETSPELITDRPDITESAATVHPGWLQIETGFLLLQDDFVNENGITDVSIYNLAGTLLRFGLSESVELRVTGSYRIFKTENSFDRKEFSGISDLLVGAKVSVIKNKSGLPDFAILAHLFLPFGQRFFRSETIEPQLILAGMSNLGKSFSISYNAGGRWNFKDDLSIYILSITGGFSIIKNLNGYVELFGEFSNVLNPGYFFDGGITYLPAGNIQFDISSGFGILNNSSLWFISTGLTARIPR